MNILNLILGLACTGFLVWLILQIPMPEIFKRIILGVICLTLVIWLLQQLGVVGAIPVLRLK